jgi:twitching motility protein PilT
MTHERLDRLLRVMSDLNASDLHLKVGSPPRVRVNGDLTKLAAEEILTHECVAEMAQTIMRPEVAQTFAQLHEADFAYAVHGTGRFRANVFRQRGSPAMVFRRVRTSAANFDELGLPEVVSQLANEQRGLVLVTGPTGSGKTTTLAAMIDHINRTREVHVVTIEDPIEVLHRDEIAEISQREVGFDTQSFANAMRSAMRQDPDVILVGEMRDQETVAAALSAAETEIGRAHV